MRRPIITTDVLDTLCPMNMVLNRDGMIMKVGPTLEKLHPSKLVGRIFFDVFFVQYPSNIRKISDLISFDRCRMHLCFVGDTKTRFKAAISCSELGAVLNLSFGFGLSDAVKTYDLVNSDFAGTDLALEFLYIMEAKDAVLQANKNMHLRLREEKQTAETLALTDPLTGLYNRRAVNGFIENLIHYSVPFACMNIDLDYFKSVNDDYGHAAGDKMLTAVADILKSEIRAEDCAARVGGDEFVLVFKNLTKRDDLDRIAKRIIQKVEVPVRFEGHLCQISSSIGTAVSKSYAQLDVNQILNDADLALYSSKKAGRGRHTFYSSHVLQ